MIEPSNSNFTHAARLLARMADMVLALDFVKEDRVDEFRERSVNLEAGLGFITNAEADSFRKHSNPPTKA